MYSLGIPNNYKKTKRNMWGKSYIDMGVEYLVFGFAEIKNGTRKTNATYINECIQRLEALGQSL